MKSLNFRSKLLWLLKFVKKKPVTVFLAVVLIIAVGFILRNTNKKSGYIFEKAEKTTLTEIVSESGNIESDGNIFVYSPTNGSISQIYVKNDDHVVKGQDLFEVVSSATEIEKQTAYANYLTAKATLDADNASLYSLQSSMYSSWKTYKDTATSSTFENSDGTPKTSNRVLPEFTTVQNDWLAAEAQYKNQQGVIAKDQAAVNSAYNTFLSTQTSKVKSPLDGIVSNISVSAGKTVNAKSVLSPSPKPILVIKNSEALEAVIPVGQTNIAKVEIGQEVIIRPDAYKDKNYQGTVIRIDSLGENIQGVVMYNVYVNVTGDKFLKPGMTFDSDIITRKLNNVLTVPNSAIVLDKGVKTVRVYQNNKLINLPVNTGVKGQTRTQIIDGISAGQEIVVALTNEKAQKPSLLGL